jgi:hypothetical protein
MKEIMADLDILESFTYGSQAYPVAQRVKKSIAALNSVGAPAEQYGEAPRQHTQLAMCLGCEYWKLPSQGHCMRGEGTAFCFKVGTHAGVR